MALVRLPYAPRRLRHDVDDEAGAILRRRHRLRGSCSRRRVREDAACMTSHAARCPTFLYAVQKAVIVGHRKRCGECKAEPNENGNIYEKG